MSGTRPPQPSLTRAMTVTLAVVGMLASGCSTPAVQEPEPAVGLQQDNEMLQQRIIELAHTQAEAQNERDRQSTQVKNLERDLETLQHAYERQNATGTLALEAIETLVTCLNTQQQWVDLLTSRIAGEEPSRTVLDRTISELNGACSAAQDTVRALNDHLAVP